MPFTFKESSKYFIRSNSKFKKYTVAGAAAPSNESLVVAMGGKEIWLDASMMDGSAASNNPSNLAEIGDGINWTDRTGSHTLTQYSSSASDQPYYRSSYSQFNNKGAVHFPQHNVPLYISAGKTSGFKHLFVVHNAPYSNEAGTHNNTNAYPAAFGHMGEHRSSNQDLLLIRGSGSDATRHLYPYDATYGEHYFENNAAFKDGVQVTDTSQSTYVASSRTLANEPFALKTLSTRYTYPSSFVDSAGTKPVIWEFKLDPNDQALRYLNRGEVGSKGFIYHIGEFLAFTDHISDADRLTVYKYLSDKYDIPIYTGETAVVQEANLEHWYRFEEGEVGGTGKYIRDWTGADTSTYVRNGATIQSGRRGGCVRFADGANDEVSWTSFYLTISSSYTFAFWAKRDNSAGGSAVTLVNGSDGIEVQIEGSNTVFMHDSTSISTSTVPTQGDWAHYAITYNGTTMTAYIDGVSVGTASLSSPSTSGYLRCGRGIASANAFVGDVDDIRLYSTDLTSSELSSVVSGDIDGQYHNL
jgi:hypothetical protein